MKQGLPGLVDNLFKFLANLGFAPALGALSAVTHAGGDNGGRGLVGMIATAGGLGERPGGYGGGGGYNGGYGGNEPLDAYGYGPQAEAAMAARGGGFPGAPSGFSSGGIPAVGGDRSRYGRRRARRSAALRACGHRLPWTWRW